MTQCHRSALSPFRECDNLGISSTWQSRICGTQHEEYKPSPLLPFLSKLVLCAPSKNLSLASQTPLRTMCHCHFLYSCFALLLHQVWFDQYLYSAFQFGAHDICVEKTWNCLMSVFYASRVLHHSTQLSSLPTCTLVFCTCFSLPYDDIAHQHRSARCLPCVEHDEVQS